MSNTPPATNIPLPPLTPGTLLQRFPDLPTWAIRAFNEVYSVVQQQQHQNRVGQKQQRRLSPEARALLNVAVLPMPGYIHDYDQAPIFDCNVEIKSLFVSEESYKDGREQVILIRLGKEVERLWRGE